MFLLHEGPPESTVDGIADLTRKAIVLSPMWVVCSRLIRRELRVHQRDDVRVLRRNVRGLQWVTAQLKETTVPAAPGPLRICDVRRE